jgi:rSAM/selenodomain-associated transferase 1
MARYPEPGAVKTRLARAIGAAPACRLYRAFLADLHGGLGAAGWPVVWAVTPPEASFSELLQAPVAQIAQRGETLGARMAHAVADMFAGGARRVLMIGADAPHIVGEPIAALWRGLDTADCVLLPTRDGGYCAIALAAPLDLFSSVEMGTARVFDETLVLARRLGARTAVMPPTFDVDEMADLVTLTQLLEREPHVLPATRAALPAGVRPGV